MGHFLRYMVNSEFYSFLKVKLGHAIFHFKED